MPSHIINCQIYSIILAQYKLSQGFRTIFRFELLANYLIVMSFCSMALWIQIKTYFWTKSGFVQLLFKMKLPLLTQLCDFDGESNFTLPHSRLLAFVSRNACFSKKVQFVHLIFFKRNWMSTSYVFLCLMIYFLYSITW